MMFLLTRSIKLAPLFLFVGYTDLWAQTNLRLERLSIKDGLSQADVRCMIQDNYGFLWIGTRDGLNKYDGRKFRKFLKDKNDSTSLSFNQITDLELDSIGNLWIGSDDGISYYDYRTDGFRNYFLNKEEEAFTEVNDIFIHEDDSGTLVLSTNNGLRLFNAERSFHTPQAFEEFKDKNIAEFHSSEKYGTWVATRTGLYHKAHPTAEWRYLLENTWIEDLYFDQSKVYISTAEGFFKYHIEDRSLEEIALPVSHNGVFQAWRAQSGDLWIACGEVVVLGPDDKTVKNVFDHERNNNFSLSENQARSLYQTRDNVLWIGTFGYGLNKYNPDIGAFAYLGEESAVKLNTNYISSIFTNNDTRIFVGTSRGVNVVDLQKREVKNFLDDGDINLVYKIKGDSDGDVWVSTAKGLYAFRDNKLAQVNFPPWPMYDMVDWDGETLLLSTRRNGVFLFKKNNNTYTELIAAEKLPGVIYAVHVTKDSIWLASQDGLRVFTKEGELKRHFRSGSQGKNVMPSDVVKCIFSDHLHQLWIGTWGGGLSRVNADGTFTTFDQSKGLPSNVVYGIVEDGMGILWISTNLGITAFDPRKIEFKNFDYYDGLQGNEFNTGAYFQSIYGKIYFGGTDGLSIFDPENVLIPTLSPAVLITEILINNTPLKDHAFLAGKSAHLTRELKSDWRQNNITLEFTSVNFKHADKLVFQYSIDDEGRWYDIGDRRYLELINLPSGRHQVSIRAKGPKSNWSDKPYVLTIDIVPPFWKRTYVMIAAVALLFAVAYGAYRVRINFLSKINLTLNKLVKERTQEIQIKNEEIVAQNEALTRNSDLLAEKNLLLDQQHHQLKTLSAELENKVDERTRDIQLLNQDLSKQYVQLEQFSFIAAHNFNAPVARIKGLIELSLQNDLSKEELRLLLTHLRSSADDLDDVTRDINTILKLKKNSPGPLEPVSLSEVLQKTLSLLEEEIQEKGMTLDLQSFESLSITGWKPYVQSIFYILIENAIKYTSPKRPPLLKITCRQVNKAVKIEFIDNGVGIDLKLAMNKIFRLYQRFTPTISGKGLGLYLVKTQVDIMGGSVSVESIPEAGSTFILTFPVEGEV